MPVLRDQYVEPAKAVTCLVAANTTRSQKVEGILPGVMYDDPVDADLFATAKHLFVFDGGDQMISRTFRIHGFRPG